MDISKVAVTFSTHVGRVRYGIQPFFAPYPEASRKCQYKAIITRNLHSSKSYSLGRPVEEMNSHSRCKCRSQPPTRRPHTNTHY